MIASRWQNRYSCACSHSGDVQSVTTDNRLPRDHVTSTWQQLHLCSTFTSYMYVRCLDSVFIANSSAYRHIGAQQIGRLQSFTPLASNVICTRPMCFVWSRKARCRPTDCLCEFLDDHWQQKTRVSAGLSCDVVAAVLRLAGLNETIASCDTDAVHRT